MTRDTWPNIPIKTRRKVKAYAAAKGLKVAEAATRLLEKGLVREDEYPSGQ